MSCCCCPSRETFGNTTLWLVQKSTGDIVWRRASGDEVGGGGSNRLTLKSPAGLYLTDKGVSGASRVEHYSPDGPYMDLDKGVRRSAFSGIGTAWGDGVASGMGTFVDGGETIDALFWYTERTTESRLAIYGEFTDGGVRQCGSWDGNLAGGGTIGTHEDPIPIETVSGAERCYLLRFRSGGTPSNVWVIHRRDWPAKTDHEVATIARARFADGSLSGFGQPFSHGTTVYGMEMSVNDVAGNPFPSPPHILLRSWDAYTGAQIAAIDTQGVNYAQRGWVGGENIYYLGTGRGTLYCMKISDGTILGSHSVSGMSGSVGPDVAYVRPDGDFMLTSGAAFGSVKVQRFAPDGTEKWVRTGISSQMHWPIEDLTIGAFGLLEEDGSTRWQWRNLNALRAVYDLDDLILCAGSLGA